MEETMSIENRLAAKKRAQQAKVKRRRNKILKIVGICLIPIIICVVAYFVMLGVIKKNADSSAFVNADGTIKGRAAKSYVTLCDYKNITVNREDYLPTETELQTAMDNVMSSYVETVTESGTEIQEDSKVNLTYTVKVDGEELTDLAATDKAYTLGSKTLTEAFDTEIAKLTVGDTFSIEISFPEDYSTEALAGKKAVIAGSVVSVQVVPEITDAFVAEKLTEYMDGSDYPLTAEGFKNFCAYKLYTNALETYVDEYITKNTTVNSYPYFYLKTQYYLKDSTYEYYVDYYNQLLGSTLYDSPVTMLGLDSRSEYKKRLNTEAKTTAAYYLAYQAIYEDAGLAAVTEQDVKDYVAEQDNSDYDKLVAETGYNYLAQMTLKDKTFDYVMSLVKTDGDASQMWKADVATGSDADAK